MKKEGFTLFELLITSAVIVPIIALAICSLFIVQYNFRGSIEDLTSASREARIGMEHMVRVLRLADPGSIFITNNGHNIYARVKGGQLSYASFDSEVRYSVTSKKLKFVLSSLDSSENFWYYVANSIESLSASWSRPELSLELKAVQGRHPIIIKTMVRVLGGL